MRKNTLILAGLLMAAPLFAQASCESLKSEISQKIIKNGVPENDFTLDIVPNDQADKAGGQIVGHCDNDTQKIVYKRNDSERGSSVPANAGTSQDSPAQ